jgi:hypothetical protein
MSRKVWLTDRLYLIEGRITPEEEAEMYKCMSGVVAFTSRRGERAGGTAHPETPPAQADTPPAPAQPAGQ